MRLVVKKDGKPFSQFDFNSGPVFIGRSKDCKVILPDRSVSKKHAKISFEDEQWFIEDLGSSNKTYVQNNPITKTKLSSGLPVKITSFTIDVDLTNGSSEDLDLDGEIEMNFNADIDDELAADETVAVIHEDSLENQPLPPEFADESSPQPQSDPLSISQNQSVPPAEMNLQASLTNPMHDIVVRKPDAGHAPAMRLAANRLIQFSKATERICDCTDLDQLLMTLLDITIEQFQAVTVWCALRDKPDGPMICHAGKTRNNQPVQLDDLSLKDKIVQCVEKGQFVVLPRVAPDIESSQKIRSSVIAAINRPDGCYGVLYAHNAMIHDHYSLSDLDYLMLIAIHTAAELKHIAKVKA